MLSMRFALVVALAILPELASAQVHVTSLRLAQPAVEVGGSLGIGWWFAGNDLTSVRVTVNHTGDLATEIAVAREGPKEDLPRTAGMQVVVLSVRVMQPPNHKTSRAFVSAGLAVSLGLPRKVSPVLSAGAQTNWLLRTAIRVEAQRLFGAKDFAQASRLLVGVSVGLGSR